jgi:general stress protein YciG
MANRTNNQRNNEEEKGQMTVREAGEKGGERTAETHGREFYEEIGHKGGQRVRELIEEGKEAEGGKQSSTDD